MTSLARTAHRRTLGMQEKQLRAWYIGRDPASLCGRLMDHLAVHELYKAEPLIGHGAPVRELAQAVLLGQYLRGLSRVLETLDRLHERGIVERGGAGERFRPASLARLSGRRPGRLLLALNRDPLNGQDVASLQFDFAMA